MGREIIKWMQRRFLFSKRGRIKDVVGMWLRPDTRDTQYGNSTVIIQAVIAQMIAVLLTVNMLIYTVH